MNLCKLKFDSNEELMAFNSVWLVGLGAPKAPFTKMVKSIRDYLEIKFIKHQMDGKKKPSITLKYHEAVGLMVFLSQATDHLNKFQTGDYEQNTIQRKLFDLHRFCV